MTIAGIRKSLKAKISPYLSEFMFDFKVGKVSGYYLEHKGDSVRLEASFDCLDRPNGKELRGGSLEITFIEVENILHPIVSKAKFGQTFVPPAIDTTTFRNYDNTEAGLAARQKLATVHIDSEADIERYCEVLKGYLEGYAFPWFEKYSKLEAVNELINSFGMQDMLNWFSGPFPGQFFRAMVIAQQCGNAGRVAEIKEECLRRFKDCETDSFYTKEMIASYHASLDELCNTLGAR